MIALEQTEDESTKDLWGIIDAIKESVAKHLSRGNGKLVLPTIVDTSCLSKLKAHELEFVLQRLRGFRLQDIVLKWIPNQWCFELVPV